MRRLAGWIVAAGMLAGAGGCRPAGAASAPAKLSGAPPMPMPVDRQRTADQRWLAKPVLASRVLDSMEDAATWSLAGPGTMSLSGERFRDGKQSVRVVSPTVLPRPDNRSGRPFGEATLRRRFDGENWQAFNRISVWVYPTMPEHKIGSVVLRLSNDGIEKHPLPFTRGTMHYALVKPGQWNRIVWEIEHLSRDKVTELALIYRLQGNEPGTATEVSFDWDCLELQKVEPDHYEGWKVWPGRIAYSHSGYELHSPKTALASGLEAEKFELLRAGDGKVVLDKPVRVVKSGIGQFQVMEFSEISEPGQYILRVGQATTPPFAIAENVWRETVWKTINFFYCERCGDRIAGVHDVCHEDWQAEHNGRRIPINGGWHDAGDLSQGLTNTAEAVHAMFRLAEELAPHDKALADRLIEEGKWGLGWVHKTRFGDGFRVTWATMDYWTDGKVGTMDDTFGSVGDRPGDNAVGSAASAVAARVLADPDLAARSLAIARQDWQFAVERLRNPNVETISALALASTELYKTTGEPAYAEKAAEMARLLIDSQQTTWTDWSTPMVGFYYTSPRRERILNYMHRGHDQAPVAALVELCRALPNHPDWMSWYASVAMYCDFLQSGARFQEPWGVLAAGVYAADRDREQVVNGLKLSDSHYLRRFPVWFEMRGHYGILLSQSKALAAAGRLRNRRELADLCQVQLQWVVGRNPFAQSTMYGEGHDCAPQYTAMSGDMVGSLPVGIQTRGNEDLPYWPVTNCWNYKEVWVHPSSRWLYIMADLMSRPAAPGQVAFTLTQQPAAEGRVTIAARVRGAGQHSLTLRGHNLEIERPAQAVDLRPQFPQTITWSAKVKLANVPWVAVVYPDDDLSRKRDLMAAHPRRAVE